MRRKPDYTFLILVGVLTVAGLLVLSSASSPAGLDRFGDSYYFVKRQLLFGFLPGLAGLAFFTRIDYRKMRGWTWIFLSATLLLLALVFIPGLGASFGRTQSWILLGGVSLQPAELAKLAFIGFLAAYFGQIAPRELAWRKLLPPALATLAVMALIARQPDVGTLILFFMIAIVLAAVSGVGWRYLLAVCLAAAAGIVAMVKAAPYRAARITAFLHPELDPQGIGYHINQAFLAIGSGGFWGMGLGHSRQKFQYLPEVTADSIFAVLGEELGFALTTVFVVLLACILLRGVRIARRASDRFGRLLVVGIVAWLSLQSFINIGAMAGLLPLTGLPLPFVSHGGTALAAALWGVGAVLSVSRYSKEP